MIKGWHSYITVIITTLGDTDPILDPDPDPYFYLRFAEISEKVQHFKPLNDLLPV
jgi:hypothetical protein